MMVVFVPVPAALSTAHRNLQILEPTPFFEAALGHDCIARAYFWFQFVA